MDDLKDLKGRMKNYRFFIKDMPILLEISQVFLINGRGILRPVNEDPLGFPLAAEVVTMMVTLRNMGYWLGLLEIIIVPHL